MLISRPEQIVLNAWMAITGTTPDHLTFNSHAAIARAPNGEAAWVNEVNHFVNAHFGGPHGTERLADAVIANLGLGAVPGIRNIAIDFFNSQPDNRGGLVIAAADWLRTVTPVAGETALINAQAAFRAINDAAFGHSSNPGSLVAVATTPGSPIVNPGQTFDLTTGIDRITGTASNDIILGLLHTDPALGTLQASDVINGGGGRDTLGVRVTGGVTGGFAGFGGGGSMQGVETLHLQVDPPATISMPNRLNFSGAVGLDSIFFEMKGAQGSSIQLAPVHGRDISITTLATAQSYVGIDEVRVGASFSLSLDPLTNVGSGIYPDGSGVGLSPLMVFHGGSDFSPTLTARLDGNNQVNGFEFILSDKTQEVVVSGNLGPEDYLWIFSPSESTVPVTIDTTGVSTSTMILGTNGGSLIAVGSGTNFIGGGAGVDQAFGGAGRDLFDSRGGADVFWGGGGNDLFRLENIQNTRSAEFSGAATRYSGMIDHFADFNGAGALEGDQFAIDMPAGAFGSQNLAFSGATVVNVTAVTVASASSFTALAAAITGAQASTAAVAQVFDVTVSSGSLAGRVMVINDDVAGIQTSDAFVNITGIAGNLHASDFVFM